MSVANHILKHPFLYWSYQKIVGGDRARKYFITKNVAPKSGQKIFDIGCGPGNILDYLPKNITYYGFDVDANYIEDANKNYGDRGHFKCSTLDDYDCKEMGNFDLVLANGVIHHLNDDEASKLFALAKKALKPSGKLMTFDGCYVKGQSPIAHYLLKKDRGNFVRTQEAYRNIAEKQFKNTKTLIPINYFRIPYTSIVIECQKD